MCDLIDRQAAIDAVKAYLTDCQIEDADWHGNGIEYELESLPSAHPHWIPCSERLPGKNCRCLTTNTAWGAFEVDWNVWINGEWLYQNEKPIAWMPLPEPYKEDDHETD